MTMIAKAGELELYRDVLLASASFPIVFPPVEIDGRHYVDGALKKTIHASVLLDEGLDLSHLYATGDAA